MFIRLIKAALERYLKRSAAADLSKMLFSLIYMPVRDINQAMKKFTLQTLTVV